MNTLKWSDDSELHNEVFSEVAKAVPHHRGYAHIVDETKSENYSDWTPNSHAKRENIEEIIQKEKEWAKGKGFPVRETFVDKKGEKEAKGIPKIPPASPTIMASLNAVERVTNHVIQVRKKFWACTDNPFPNTLEGRKSAVEWLQAKLDEYKSSHPIYNRPTRYTISFEIDANSLSEFDDYFTEVRDRNCRVTENGEITFDKRKLVSYAAAICEVESKGLGTVEQVRYGASDSAISISNEHGFTSRFLTPRNSYMFELFEAVEEVSKASRWWTSLEALDFIMLGRIPPAGIKTNISMNEYGVQVTLVIQNPIPESELLEFYKGLFNEEKVRGKKLPKPLTQQQSALIQFVEKTPNLTWSARHEFWKEKYLNRRSFTKYASYRSFRQAHARALEQSQHKWADYL